MAGLALSGWLCDAFPDTPEVHIVPIGDAVNHGPVDCVCGPRVEPVKRADGSMGWLVVHAPLDGRELSEPDRRATSSE